MKAASRAHSSIAELFLTDLCFDTDAESRCETATTAALALDAASVDGRLALASLRLSQSRTSDACVVAEQLVL